MSIVDNESSSEEFILFKFYKTGLRETEIYQVYELNKRIGWIFPIISLTSNEHGYSENKHFLKYAKIAFDIILNSIDKSRNNKLPQNTVLLILYKENIDDYPNFNIEYYYPSLFQYGYMTKNIDYENNNFKTGNKRITIQKQSKELDEESYLLELFDELIYEKHPLVKFHVLYQVVELFLEKILLNEIKLLSNLIENKKLYSGNIKRQFEDFEAASKRIKNLITDKNNKGYLNNKITSEIEDNFQQECDYLLNLLGRTDVTNESLDKSLYGIRNFIVHDYRNIPVMYHTHLKKINSNFELFICELLLKFEPKLSV